MSTIQEIIEEALDYFDEPASTTGKYNQDGYKMLTRVANRYYRDVCKKTFCSRVSTMITTAAGVREYALSTGFVALKKAIYKGFPLLPIDEFKAMDSCGPLSGYYVIGLTTIGFNPLPRNVEQITIHYFNKPTEQLTADRTPSMVPEDYHYVIAYGITAELFKIDKGDRSESYLKWQSLYEAEVESTRLEIRKTNKDKFPSLG